MAMVSDFLSRVLSSIAVIRVGGSPSAAQSQLALDALNEMLGAWSLVGIAINDGDLGLTDTFPFESVEKAAMVENLAVKVAMELGKPINPARVYMADKLYRDLLNKYHQDYSIEFDTALVNLGGGNYDIENDI